MATQVLPRSTDSHCEVHQLPEPVYVQSHVVHAPLSPPPTIKKFVSIFSTSPFHIRDSQKSSGKGKLNQLVPGQGSRRTHVKLFYIFAVLLALFCWWRSGTEQDFEILRQRANTLTKNLLPPSVLDGLHFIPANNQHIHYVGRWMYTTNRLRRDSNFPGAYLEFVVRNCSSVYLSLHNSELPNTMQEIALNERDVSHGTHLNFGPVSGKTRITPPVSLLSRVDYGEYQYFPRSRKGLVAITAAALAPSEDHTIRIMAPGINGEEYAGMEFEGLWLNNGGSLISSPKQRKVIRPKVVSDGTSMLFDESGQYLWQHLETGEDPKDRSSGLNDTRFQHSLLLPRKTLEIVTDVPRTLRTPTNNGSLAALQGWEEVIGDMFGVDHVSIMLDGVCLMSPCIGGLAQPASVKDAYFRSGPPGSSSFARAWNFRSSAPDALVLVLGRSDEASFRKHMAEYEKSMQDLRRQFEDSYVKFVQAVRRAAYPLHPAALHDYSSNADGFVYNSAPATIPIFVVSPFTGEMRHTTQNVVEKLQSGGDKAVFWLDTSGWLSSADFDADADGDGHEPAKRRPQLNSQGNRRAAVFLHAHLCHYLAQDQTQCPFLKHEAYTGKVFVPKEAELEKYMEESKVKKLKALFWPADTK